MSVTELKISFAFALASAAVFGFAILAFLAVKDVGWASVALTTGGSTTINAINVWDHLSRKENE